MAWWRILAVGVVLILAVAPPVAGQEVAAQDDQQDRPSFGMSMSGGEAAMAVAIGRASVDRYADLLGFDEHQREAAMMLHEAYLEEYKLAADAIARGMIDLEDESKVARDRDEFRSDLGRLWRGMLDQQIKLEERLLGDLERLAALPDDDDTFARVERARRRELAHAISRVNGAWVDLFDVAERTGVRDEPGVSDILREYETQIDAAHRPLIQAQLAVMRGGIDLMEEPYAVARERSRGEAYQAWAEALTRTLADSDARAKATNERFSRQIARALPEDEATAWTNEFNRRAWPVVYRVSDAQRVLDAAAGLEDLTGEQREQLDALRAGYEPDAASINQRWAKAIDTHQAGAGNPWPGGGESADVERARADREELDERLIERVRGLLTPEQAERLPDTGGVDADEVVRELGGR